MRCPAILRKVRRNPFTVALERGKLPVTIDDEILEAQCLLVAGHAPITALDHHHKYIFYEVDYPISWR